MMTCRKHLRVFIDGASSGNPGDAGAGVFILDDEGRERRILFYLGQTTNNVAEYMALILALEELKRYSAEAVTVYSDSELLVKQIEGKYRVKSEALLRLYRKVVRLLEEIGCVKIVHVPRDQNKEADYLAKKSIDLARLVGQSSRLSDWTGGKSELRRAG